VKLRAAGNDCEVSYRISKGSLTAENPTCYTLGKLTEKTEDIYDGMNCLKESHLSSPAAELLSNQDVQESDDDTINKKLEALSLKLGVVSSRDPLVAGMTRDLLPIR
jgi:hypothetical protein